MTSNDSKQPDDEEDRDDFPIQVDDKGEPKPAKRQPRRGSDPMCPKVGRARVQRIALLMSTGQWNYQAAFALAMEWGVAISTVKHYATRAGELLDLIVDTAPDLERLMSTTLLTIVTEAMGGGKYRDAIEAIKTLAGLKGLDKTHQAAQQTTNNFVGVDDLLAMAAQVRAAAEANAAAEPKAQAEDGGE